MVDEFSGVPLEIDVLLTFGAKCGTTRRPYQGSEATKTSGLPYGSRFLGKDDQVPENTKDFSAGRGIFKAPPKFHFLSPQCVDH